MSKQQARRLTRRERRHLKDVVELINRTGEDNRAFQGGLQTFAWMIEDRLKDLGVSEEVLERFKDPKLQTALYLNYQKNGGFEFTKLLELASLRSGAPVMITINADVGTDPPHKECDCEWTPYSFCRRHINFKDPEELGLGPGPSGQEAILGASEELKKKLDEGLAFVLSYYEHGDGQWSLAGEGMQCRWDSVSVAGLLLWEWPEEDLGPKTLEDRAKDARRFLEAYTDWCNGRVYDIRVEVDGEDVDGAGNVPGCHLDDYLRYSVHPHTKDARPDDINIRGDAAWLQQYHSFQPDDTKSETTQPETQIA